MVQILGLLSVLGAAVQAPLSESQAAERAIAFSNYIRSGAAGNTDHLSGLREVTKVVNGVTVLGEAFKTVHLSTGERMTCEVATGRMYGYHIAERELGEGIPAWPVAGALGLRAAMPILQNYFRAAGYGETLIYRESAEHSYVGGKGAVLAIVAGRSLNGVEYAGGAGVEFWIHPVSGELLLMQVEFNPHLPSNLTPDISTRQASAILFAHALAAENTYQLVEDESYPVRLRAWVPTTREEEEGIGSTAYQRILRDRQARLVYDGTFHRDVGQPSGKVRHWVNLIIDAHTGALLRRYYLNAFGGGDVGRPKAPLELELDPGPLSVMRRSKALTVPEAEVCKAEPKEPRGPATEVILCRGRLAFRVKYYPDPNLLVKGDGKNRKFGTPNPALRKAILKLAGGPDKTR